MPPSGSSRNLRVCHLIFETAAVGFVLFGIVGKLPDSWHLLWKITAWFIAWDHLSNKFDRSGLFKKIDIPAYRPKPEIEKKIQLRELDELRATSSITPAEYERRRNEIMDPY